MFLLLFLLFSITFSSFFPSIDLKDQENRSSLTEEERGNLLCELLGGLTPVIQKDAGKVFDSLVNEENGESLWNDVSSIVNDLSVKGGNQMAQQGGDNSQQKLLMLQYHVKDSSAIEKLQKYASIFAVKNFLQMLRDGKTAQITSLACNNGQNHLSSLYLWDSSRVNANGGTDQAYPNAILSIFQLIEQDSSNPSKLYYLCRYFENLLKELGNEEIGVYRAYKSSDGNDTLKKDLKLDNVKKRMVIEILLKKIYDIGISRNHQFFPVTENGLSSLFLGGENIEKILVAIGDSKGIVSHLSLPDKKNQLINDSLKKFFQKNSFESLAENSPEKKRYDDANIWLNRCCDGLLTKECKFFIPLLIKSILTVQFISPELGGKNLENKVVYSFDPFLICKGLCAENIVKQLSALFKMYNPLSRKISKDFLTQVIL